MPKNRWSSVLRASGATVLFLILLATPLLQRVAAAQGLADSSIATVSVAEHLARGDELYALAQLASARDAYLAALEAEPDHYVTLCRLVRAESELGEDLPDDEQKRLFEAAEGHARAAVRIAPDSAQGHVWLAIALGRMALKSGAKKRLSLSREIKSEIDQAMAIDSTIGRAYHVRAIWNRKLASLNFMERLVAKTVLGGVPKGATKKNAVRDLEKAIELEPDYVNHHLELGRTFKQFKRKREARLALEKALALSPNSSPRDSIYQAQARALLEKLQ